MMLTSELMAKLPADLVRLGWHVREYGYEWYDILTWNLTIASLLWFASDLADARWIKANL